MPFGLTIWNNIIANLAGAFSKFKTNNDYKDEIIKS